MAADRNELFRNLPSDGDEREISRQTFVEFNQTL